MNSRRRIVVFGVVALGLLMTSVDQTIVASALPAIRDELGGLIEWSGWIVTIYAFGQVLMLPVAGKLADRYGRRRVLMIAATVFGLSSLACAFAEDIAVLVALRFVQALGGGAFLPSATGVVAEHFVRNRDRVLGLFSSIFSIGAVIGPTLGGLLVTVASWRWIFLVNVPLCIVLIVVGLIVIPRDRPGRTERFDVIGLLLLAVFLLSVMFGLTSLSGVARGDPPTATLIALAVAAVSLALLVWRLRAAAAPFLSATLIWGRQFRVMNVLNVLIGMSALGLTILLPFYAQERFGMSPLESGTLLSARAVGTILVSGVVSFSLRRTGYRLPIWIGFLIMAVGLIGIAIVPQGVSPGVWLFFAGGVCGLGMGAALPALNNASLRLAPDDVGSIAGIRSMFRQVGSMMIISVATAMAASATDPGVSIAETCALFAVLLCCALPLVWRVPEHRGAW